MDGAQRFNEMSFFHNYQNWLPTWGTADNGTMIERICTLTDNPRLIRFAEFVIGEAGGRRFPTYKSVDLMTIAPLVQHVWVLDFTKGVDNQPKIVFSGTHIDAHYGMNVIGKCLEEIYVEDDFDQAVRGNYYQVCAQKKVAYTRRFARYHNDRVDRYRTAEAIMFPCSSNDEDIDYGLAFMEYSSTSEAPPEKVFRLL